MPPQHNRVTSETRSGPLYVYSPHTHRRKKCDNPWMGNPQTLSTHVSQFQGSMIVNKMILNKSIDLLRLLTVSVLVHACWCVLVQHQQCCSQCTQC